MGKLSETLLMPNIDNPKVEAGILSVTHYSSTSGIGRICFTILVQDRAFSDKKNDLRVKKIVIYLRVDRKMGGNDF